MLILATFFPATEVSTGLDVVGVCFHWLVATRICIICTVKLLSNCPTLVISTFWIISKEKISHNMLMPVSRLKGKNVSEYKLEFIWC
jgi:hypothetical protein